MNNINRRRVLTADVALAASTVLSLASTSALAQSASKLMKSLANEFFLTMENGAKDYQKHNTGQFDLVTPTASRMKPIRPRRSASSSR